MEASPTEIKYGPLTIFPEEMPPLPSVAEQAATVAQFYKMMYLLSLYGDPVDEKALNNLARFAEGDLSFRYRQKSIEEVEEEKKVYTFEVNGEIHKVYDEHIMNQSLLPIEEQLQDDFLSARLHLWLTANSEPITWHEWDGYRELSDIPQASLTAALNPPRTDWCARDYASRLLSQAIEIPEHSSTNSQSLRELISRDIFLRERIAYPIHHSEPIRVPERIPEWVWRSGLRFFLPGWGTIQEEPQKKQRGRPRKASNTLPHLIPFTQDRTVYAVGDLLSGRSNPPFIPEINSFDLGKITAGKTKKYDNIFITARTDSIVAPNSAQGVLDRIVQERDELKGKVFVGTLGLAKDVAARGQDPTRFPAPLHELMKLFFGYELKKKTNSKQYWKAAAQLTRYLWVDLPMLDISLHLTQTHGPGRNQPRPYSEPLMKSPGVYVPPRKDLPIRFRENVRNLVLSERMDDLAEYLQQSDVEGFTLGYERNALEALGGQDLRVASELMSREVLALTGPAWWLAYRVVAHLRRWQAGKDVAPEKGKSLVEALREPGYLDQHRDRVSYKDALRNWLKDIEHLIELDVLEAPGMRVYHYKGRRWVDCSDELDQLVSSGRTVRITEAKLEGMRVLYTLPSERHAAMRQVRKRAQDLAKSAKARQAANNSVRNGKKPSRVLN